MNVEQILYDMITHPKSPYITSGVCPAGDYYAVSPDHQASISLGHINLDDTADLFNAIREMITVAGDTADWSDWYLSH